MIQRNQHKILAILYFVICFIIVVSAFPEGTVAIFPLIFGLLIVNFIISRFSENAAFLQRVFMIGLLLRVSLGTIIHVFELRDFFGPDSFAYDAWANRIVDIWSGNIAIYSDEYSQIALRMQGAGWGMKYFVAFIYFITGRNILAAQFCCAVIGASISLIIYHCAHKVFDNVKVAKRSAWLAAVFPAFVVWTCQLLKDGLVIFLLVTVMYSVVVLLERFSIKFIFLLIFCLFGLLTLRFYVAYVVVIAIMGSFLVGTSNSIQSIITRTATIVFITLGLAYLGGLKDTEQDFKTYGNLEKVQVSRHYLATSSESGYAQEGDASTPEGAILVLPVGFMYLMFAPFPWEARNFRQFITIPDILLWWSLLPLALSGILYTVKNRLRKATGILLFTFLLTIVYSLFQGNVGTAYRQRSQIQVFIFIFISVALTLREERRELKS
jgi:hypothetical protein